ncbi:MAG: hypothetical protein HQL69_21590 [Magnetococcales bacterium]|nr:hypothetical protein [Magnetococcales bacterium]
MAKSSSVPNHTAPCPELQKLGQEVVALREQFKTLFNGQAELKIQNSAVLENTQTLLLGSEKVSQLEYKHLDCKQTAKEILDKVGKMDNRIKTLESQHKTEEGISSTYLKIVAGFISFATLSMLVLQTWSMFFRAGG